MRETESNLTLYELEVLCNLYLECKLTHLEEAELEFILQNYHFQTPLIIDVKKIMGFEKLKYLKPDKQTKDNIRQNKWINIISGIAASLLILLVISFYFLSSHDCFGNSDAMYCRVYENGKQVNPKEALRIADRNLKKIEDFEEKIKFIEKREKEKVENFNILNNVRP